MITRPIMCRCAACFRGSSKDESGLVFPPFLVLPCEGEEPFVESVGATISFVPRSSRRAPGRPSLGYSNVTSLEWAKT